MAVLAILQPDARTSARLSSALEDGHRLIARRSWDGVERVLTERGVEGCLVDADHPGRDEAERRIERLRTRYPGIAIIAYVGAERQGRGYLDLGGLGVDGLITADASRTRMRADVDRAFARARGAEVARALSGRLPAPLIRALSWAVAHATDQPTVECMADAIGETTRGLRQSLAAARLPSPSRILLWGRLLLAGARLERDGRTVEEVAFSLGYATSTSLARAMKHHTGHTPRQVSERGGMLLVLNSLMPRRETPKRRVSPPGGAALLAALFLLTGCATLGGPGVDGGAIDDVLVSPGIAQMHVGVLAVDAESGRTLYSRNAARKFVPASNQKILVTAAATTMLGADFRFRTEVWGIGELEGSHLNGNLVLVGSGDPTLSERFWPSGTDALRALADSVRASGVESVSGALLVDVSAWDSATVGPTWEVEDLRYTYGSTGGAFAIDEGEVRAVVRAGTRPGEPAHVRWTPLGTHDYVQSEIVTVPTDSATRVSPHYHPESRRLVLDGVAELGTVDTVAFALRDPVRQASVALARAIGEAGITVERGWEVRWTSGKPLGGGCKSGLIDSCPQARLLGVLQSPPLSEIAAGILEPSQNWMTEQLVRSLAAMFGEEGSWPEGADLVESFLFEHVGVDTLDVSARDGSGLSAYNLVTPRALVQVLRYMRAGPYRDAYRDALAEPGEEGSTLERRLPDLAGRVWAKTGSISNVNSLSGYLVGDDGREVVFSILTNGSGLPASYVRAAIDDIVRALAR